jgi:hypothetical protein
MERLYAGYYADENGAMTHFGQMVRDAWTFGLIPETEDCKGWNAAQMQILYDKICAEWDKHGQLPSRLPDDLRARHVRIHEAALRHAKAAGWDAELGEDD